MREPQQGEGQGYLCIPQCQHAAISGQIARAWGNEAFPAPRPREQVCLAAERHDDGMVGFDEEPDLDPDTGLPRSFMRMPLDSWLRCWERGPQLVAEDSAYAGLLVSLHGEHLLGYRKLERESAADRERVETWLAAQSELRGRLLAELREDELLAADCNEQAIERARKLLEIWDAMSLAICMPRLPESFAEVPCEASGREIRMREVGLPGGRVMIEVDPWPFSGGEVPLAASGRRLQGGYEDREAMLEALAETEPATLSVTLVSAEREDEPVLGSPMPG